MKRVSVIIPVYNVEAYIEECLTSVAHQTAEKDIECIIVDDRGTDKSISIAEQFIVSTKGNTSVDFKIIYRESNGGLSAARNTGIKAATGEYLFFLDSDDTIVPICIETLLKLADKYHGVDLLPALYLRENNDMQQFGKHSFPEFSDDRKLIKRSLLDYDKIPVTAHNKLIRKDFLMKFHLYFKDGIIHEDNHWTFFVAKYARKMAFCSQQLYYYRETAGSITQSCNIERETKAFIAIIKDLCDNIDDFEKGAQKRTILLTILIALNNGFISYDNNIIKTFLHKNNLIEKALLKVIFSSKTDSWLYNKTINIIQRLYLL